MLIQPPWSRAAGGDFKNVAKRYASYAPIGLMYLSAFVERNGHSAHIIDLEAEPISLEDLCAQIRKYQIGLIGITTTTPTFHIAQTYAKVLKRELGLPIVVGGPHITVLKEETFFSEFDYGIANEGEHTILELMNELEGGRNFSQIKGLMYREGEKVVVNPPRPFISDIDSIPFPDRDKVDVKKYCFEVPGKGLIPVATLELTRGCPFQCVFCSEPLNTGRGLRTRSPKNVVDEMVEVKEKYGISHFFMLDSTLTAKKVLVEEFCRELLNRNVQITFEGQTRGNLVDEPLLVLMKQAGLVRLSFGLESADPTVLKLMKKNVKIEAYREAFRLMEKLGISALCGTMMGNPGDTKKTVYATARFIRSIPQIRYSPMSIAIPYPGTELWHMAKRGEHGLKLLDIDYKYYSRWAGGVMEIAGMKPPQLLQLQRRALVLAHSTPKKMIGIIQHFGVMNVFVVAMRIIWGEVITLFGGKDPSLHSISYDNTTLKNLGMHLETF